MTYNNIIYTIDIEFDDDFTDDDYDIYESKKNIIFGNDNFNEVRINDYVNDNNYEDISLYYDEF